MSLLFSEAGAWLAGLVALVLAVLGVYSKGKRAARQETALEAAERMAKAHDTRRKIEDDIQEDVDLYDRAKRSGIVRPER